MNPTQQRIVDTLKAQITAWNARAGRTELTKFEVQKGETADWLVFVVIECSTPGALFASSVLRDSRHIMVGRRGGCTLLNAKRKTARDGMHNAIHGMTKN